MVLALLSCTSGGAKMCIKTFADLLLPAEVFSAYYFHSKNFLGDCIIFSIKVVPHEVGDGSVHQQQQACQAH